jgi:DNA-binding CsgD family transcriptional regulator
MVGAMSEFDPSTTAEDAGEEHLLALVERLALGLMLAGPSSQLLHRNWAALRMIAECRERDEPGADHPPRRCALLATIDQWLVNDRGRAPLRVVIQHCGTCTRHILGRCLRLDRDEEGRKFRLPMHALLFNKANASGGEQHEDVIAAWHLTPAESRLVGGLVKGLTTTELGRQLGISANTVKTQLRSIFRKAGVHRQVDLVRLILSMPQLHDRRPDAQPQT